MSKGKGETAPYGANKGGEISSPNNDSIVGMNTGLKNSLKVNHNDHYESFNRKGGTIETPATDIITRKGK